MMFALPRFCKKPLVIACLCWALNGIYAQRLELMGGLGTSHFLGDLGGKPTFGTNDPSDLDLLSTRYAAAGGLRFMINNRLGLQLAAGYGRVYGDDKYSQNRERNLRNLSFFSNIIEGSLMFHVHLGSTRRFMLFGGVGMFHFNPKTRYNDEVYELQPLGTEGQNFLPGKSPYSLTAISIPFGAGYKLWQSNSGGYLSIELWLRKTTTDYIDDVSTNYADKTQLQNSNGAIAVALSDRSKPGIPGIADAGAIRGHSDNNDNFAFLMCTFSQPIFGRKGVGQGYNRGGKFRKYNKCPEF